MPKTLPQLFNDAQLEAVRGLWRSRCGNEAPYSIPPYRWAQAILESSKRRDCEPWCIVRRFPQQRPRIGWWGFLKWLERNPEPMREGDLCFGSWEAKIVALRQQERDFGPLQGPDDPDWMVVEVINGVFIKIPRTKRPLEGDASGLELRS